jgi:hypothetical protein
MQLLSLILTATTSSASDNQKNWNIYPSSDAFGKAENIPNTSDIIQSQEFVIQNNMIHYKKHNQQMGMGSWNFIELKFIST